MSGLNDLHAAPVSDQWRQKESVARWVAWAWNHLVVRDDAYANYNLKGEPFCVRHRNDPDAADAAMLSAEVLAYHCRGEKVVGLYTTEPRNHTCIWMALDIDAHDDRADPAANLRFAIAVYDALRRLGFDPLLLDSNGKGGYHVVVFFTGTVAARTARAFGLWLARDHGDYGLGPVEVFPKQAELRGEKKIGNQLRLPGRHPRRDHWTKVWDGRGWLEGTAAIDEMCRDRRRDPGAIPDEARRYEPPPPPKVIARPSEWETYDTSNWPSNYTGDLKTCDLLGLFERAGRLKAREDGHFAVVCPWVDEHTDQKDTGTAVWAADGARYPGFHCFHAHCHGRGLEDVLAYFGKEAVDAACAKPFGNPGRAAEEKMFRELEEKVAEVVRPADPAALAVLPACPVGEAPAANVGFDPHKYQSPPDRRRRGYKLDALAALPPVRYLVKNHLAANALACLYGPSGAGKSFVGIEVAMSVAHGRPYLGTYDARPGPVVYLSGEGNGGIGRRFRAWCQHHRADPPDNLLVVPHPFDLTDRAEVGDLLGLVRDDLGQAPALVVVDTVARCFGGNDENSTKDMGLFVRGCDAIRAATGAAVLLVHHTGKDPARGERGNSALRAACDSMIAVDDTDGGKGSLISCGKQKDFEAFDGYIVRRRVVDLGQDGEGEDVTSCVLVPQDQGRTAYQLLPKKKKEQLQAVWAAFGAAPFGPTEAAGALAVGKSAAGEALRYLTGGKMLEAASGRYVVAAGVRPLLLVR